MDSDRRTAVRLGAITGMKVAALGSLIYLLAFVAWYVVSEFTSDPNLVGGALLTFVVGAIVGGLPAVLAGLVTGGLLGLLLGRSTSRRSPAVALVAGIVLAAAVVTLVNVVVLNLTGPLGPSLYVSLVGLPSLVFVIGFGWIGVRLQKRMTARR